MDELWLDTVVAGSRLTDTGWRGTVQPLERRKRTDPLQLWECSHRHRKQRTAEDCAKDQIRERRTELRAKGIKRG